MGVFKGRKEIAVYHESVIPMYSHNAFIEALPPIMDKEAVASLVERRPAYRSSDRNFSPEIRKELAQTIKHLIVPHLIQLDLAERFSRMIRNGYSSRNPIRAEYKRQLQAGFKDFTVKEIEDGMENLKSIRSNAEGFAIIGASGVGKTTAVESILGLYPQVIHHNEYHEQPFIQQQLVWLKIDCPSNGSIKALCYNFFQEIDSVLETRYYEKHSGSRKSVEELMPIMANIAATLGLGVLVIDEIQRLRSASSGGDQVMLNFFVKLTNTIGVPIVLVGTYQILPILARDFSQVRRVSSQGDLIWSPLKEDEEWDYFIEYIWEYQWTKTPTVLTRQLSKVLYYESAGIVDLAIKLYMITQIELITEEDGEEKITPSFIRKVAESRFVLIQSMLKALRNNDLESLKKIQDIAPGIESLNEYLEKASQPTNLKGTIATVRNVEKSGKGGTSTLSAEITRWLIEGGYGSEIASEATRRALENNQFENDLKMVRHEAYALAQRLTENPGLPVKERKEAKKTLTTKKPLGQYQGLIEVYEEAKHKKIVVVDLLKERGFLRPVSELFNSN